MYMYDIPTIDVRHVEQDRGILTTSLGNQNKWFIDGYWLKQDKMGQEGKAETLASMVYRHTTLHPSNYVHYSMCKLVTNEGVFNGCISKDFKNGYSEEHLGSLFQRKGIDSEYSFKNKSYEERFSILNYYVHELTGINAELYLKILFAMDAFLLNEDRHINNIVLLSNQREVKLAPYFDNGLSLLSWNKYRNKAPLDINVRRAKAKLLSTSFRKHLDNYNGEPLINRSSLLYELNQIDKEVLGHFYDVLVYQLNNKDNYKLLF